MTEKQDLTKNRFSRREVLQGLVGLGLGGSALSILAACGAQVPPEPLEMTIDMREYAFGPADLEFRVGQEVTLHLTNSGVLPIRILILASPISASKMQTSLW